MGGTIPLGYEAKDRKLVINADEADWVRVIFQRYLALGCVSKLRNDLEQRGVRSKQRVLSSGQVLGGGSFGSGSALPPAPEPRLSGGCRPQGHFLSR